MGFIISNPNPKNNLTGDCVIRAISIAENRSWDDIFIELMVKCFNLKDMPSTNRAWGAYLHDLGYKRTVIPNECPDCYTLTDFTNDHPKGTYIVATGTHAIAARNGNYYDTWDSGQETVLYYWSKEN